jgi:hypothetical protein
MWSARFNAESRGYDIGESCSSSGEFRAIFPAESEVDAAYRIHLLNGGTMSPGTFAASWWGCIEAMFSAS